MALDKVLSASIANGAVTAALISNTANLVVNSVTANVLSVTTISGLANVTGDMIVGGNLTVSGTMTYINTTDLNIGDAIISLNADLGSGISPTEDAGISINRGASTNAQFKWIESTDNWSLGNTTVSGIFNANDTIITGSANVSVGINVGANVIANTTAFRVGNSTVNTAITSTTITSNAVLSIGNTNVTGTANVSTGINVGANVNLSTSQINVGNSTVNTAITSTSFTSTSNTVSLGTAAYVVANGNVGIGTASPARKLELSASGDNLIRVTGGSVNARGVEFYDSSTNGSQIYSVGSDLRFFTVASAASSERMRIDSSGNLLVGTTTANNAKFAVNVVPNGIIGNQSAFIAGSKSGYAGYAQLPQGQLFVYDNTGSSSGTGGAISFGGDSGSGQQTWYAAIEARKDNSTSGDYGAAMVFYTRPSGTVAGERMRIDSSGNLGVGTTSPAYKVDVNGTINATGIQTSGSPSLSFSASKWMVQQETANQSLMYVCGANSTTYGTHFLYRATSTGTPLITMSYAANGNIGVGIAAPESKLHVFQRSDAGAAPNTPEIRIEHQDINAIGTGGSNGGILNFVNIQRDNTGWANNSIWGRINFYPSQPTSGVAQLGASILAAADGAIGGQQSASYLAFYTSDGSNGGNTGEKMRINSSGNVGIGASPSSTKLHVYGDWVSGHSTVKLQTASSFASGGATGIGLYDSNGTRNTLFYEASGGSYIGTEVNKSFYINTYGSARIGITGGGDVYTYGKNRFSAMGTAVSIGSSGSYVFNIEAVGGVYTAGLLYVLGRENGTNQTIAVYSFNLSYYSPTATRLLRLLQISRNTVNNSYGDVYAYVSNYSASWTATDQSISGTTSAVSDIYFRNAVGAACQMSYYIHFTGN